jgi:hypothetical protein
MIRESRISITFSNFTLICLFHNKNYQKVKTLKCNKFCPLQDDTKIIKKKYQQDNASCHKSRLSMAWFAENHCDVMDWPLRSPDLNPIEHIWSMIDQRISGIRFDSLAQLEDKLVR